MEGTWVGLGKQGGGEKEKSGRNEKGTDRVKIRVSSFTYVLCVYTFVSFFRGVCMSVLFCCISRKTLVEAVCKC